MYKEHAVGNCVRVHEEAHVSDPHLAEACRRVTKCQARDDGGVPPDELDPAFPSEAVNDLCGTAYGKWHELNSDNAELRAWSAEAVCLHETIDARCGDAKSRGGIVGGIVGATTLGLGGAAGGAVAGVKVAELASKSSRDVGGLVAGGIVGGVLGAGLGTGLGWLLGSWLGGLTAGSQASEDDCRSVKGELEECETALEKYKGARPQPLPFEPDGRINKSLIRGITKPTAMAPAEKHPVQPGPNGLVPIAGRRAMRSPISHDFSAIRTHAAPPSPSGDEPARRRFAEGGGTP
ncbi:hypothetical protein KXR53_23465 [Inquilinus limosus]|uniref:hypothetical protein n=1 Tax=Inquilinus limosus TaxID=171674 RepID=UPI003F160ED3